VRHSGEGEAENETVLTNSEQLHRKENGIMKAKLKNILSLAAMGVTLLATTVPTWAGRVATREVLISTSPLRSAASGSMVGARYSADNQQYIGCVAIAADHYANNFIQCHARDKSSKSLVCGSQDPKLLETVQAMTDSSSIFIEADNAKGACTGIEIYHGSDLLK
jgi:hypothetical protein